MHTDMHGDQMLKVVWFTYKRCILVALQKGLHISTQLNFTEKCRIGDWSMFDVLRSWTRCRGRRTPLSGKRDEAM